MEDLRLQFGVCGFHLVFPSNHRFYVQYADILQGLAVPARTGRNTRKCLQFNSMRGTVLALNQRKNAVVESPYPRVVIYLLGRSPIRGDFEGGNIIFLVGLEH